MFHKYDSIEAFESAEILVREQIDYIDDLRDGMYRIADRCERKADAKDITATLSSLIEELSHMYNGYLDEVLDAKAEAEERATRSADSWWRVQEAARCESIREALGA